MVNVFTHHHEGEGEVFSMFGGSVWWVSYFLMPLDLVFTK
jgi:hypothetical protein